MPDDLHQLEIDLSKIKFPSDRVTLKNLRALAEGDPDYYFGSEYLHLSNMMIREQNHAELGFAKALGDSKRIGEAIFRLVGDDWDEEKYGKYTDAKGLEQAAEMLAEYYVRFGIAEGPVSAKQAIRRIEQQAAAQAKQMMGRTGGD